LSFNLPSEAYELGKRLKETEEELLNVLEKYNLIARRVLGTEAKKRALIMRFSTVLK
jgi:hypothetical protein